MEYLLTRPAASSESELVQRRKVLMLLASIRLTDLAMLFDNEFCHTQKGGYFHEEHDLSSLLSEVEEHPAESRLSIMSYALARCKVRLAYPEGLPDILAFEERGETSRTSQRIMNVAGLLIRLSVKYARNQLRGSGL